MNKKLGLALLIAGVLLFAAAQSQTKSYDSVEGAIKTTFSQNERGKQQLWQTLRWIGVGGAAAGLLLIVFGSKSSS